MQVFSHTCQLKNLLKHSAVILAFRLPTCLQRGLFCEITSSLLQQYSNNEEITSSLLQLTFSPAFIAEHNAVWYGISIWSTGASCVPSQLLTGKAQEAEKSSAQCKHSSKTTKKSVCYQYCFY